MPRKPRSVEKSVGKSARRVAGAAAGIGRGRGPKKGAPNAGRPPSAIRASMRLALDERLHVLAEIADNPAVTPTERMKALDLLGKYGMGTTITETDPDGQAVQRSVLVVPGLIEGRAWSAATQQQQQALDATKRTLADAHGVA